MKEVEKLLDLMARLRDPNTGCPWDVKQDFVSIAPYTVEEAYEVADAIDRKNHSDLKSELGDLLFQVVFHAQMAKEQGLFDFKDVAEAITLKMKQRHPHVFGSEVVRSSDEQSMRWEAEKAISKESVLDGIAANLPELMKAVKLTKYAAVIGFDWPDIKGVLDKLDEEVAELKEAIESEQVSHIKDELGDLLFVCANLARHLEIDPAGALRQANKKFTERFQFVEKRAKIESPHQSRFDLSYLNTLWNEAKSK